MPQYLFFVIAFGAIFLTGFIGGMLPTRVPETLGGQRMLSLSNAFAGGIFFGAAIFHLWGDSIESLSTDGLGLPLFAPFLLSAFGFLLVLFLEKVLLGGKEDVGEMSADSHPAYPYVLTLVLSIHSFIAGTALGLEQALAATAALLIAILAHKAFAGIALGISLFRAGFPRSRHMKIIILFALSTPTGVVIGRILSAALEGETALLFEGAFDAVAAGTFLYVAMMDIISESFEEEGDRFWKFLMIILGIFLMLLLTFLE